jgi:hypothetical protein
MPKVIITIEDSTDGSDRVRMTYSPSVKELAQSIVGGHSDGKSQAFSMAIAIANFIIERNKRIGAGHKKGKTGLWVPGGRGMH